MINRICALCSTSVNHQVDALREGMVSVVKEIISLQSYELEKIINGKSEIDIDEWKKFTIYKGVFNEKHKVKSNISALLISGK